MATTALFIEILIAGLEAGVWIVLLALTLAGARVPSLDEVETHAKSLKEWAGLGAALILAGAYIIGIVIDRIAESANRVFEGTRLGRFINWHWGRGSYWYKFSPRVAEMRLAVMKDGGGIASFLDYQRSRVRIVRATVMNVALALLIGGLYVVRMESPVTIRWSLVLLGLALLVLSVYASEQIHAAYLERLTDAYCLLKNRLLPASYDAVAAAVCHRRRGGQAEFLLVRTKDGRRWTFPKGHIEDGERAAPWKAAEREAREEAGVIGTCSKTPLTYYLYPSAPGQEDRVAAYLLEPKEFDQKPIEDFRKPEWFTTEQALNRLREGDRERRYVREHTRVLSAAGKRLASPPSQI